MPAGGLREVDGCGAYSTTSADYVSQQRNVATALAAKQKLQQYDQHIDDNQRPYERQKHAVTPKFNEVSMRSRGGGTFQIPHRLQKSDRLVLRRIH